MKSEFTDIEWCDGKVDLCFQASSTNDMARGEGYRNGDIIIAESQSSGRGQQGNAWESEPGKNLTFSIILEPVSLLAQDQFNLLRAVSLSVAETIKSEGIDSKIKWPNDIYIGPKKAAGILIENDICGAFISRSIIGIGLNVNQIDFPTSLVNPTSLALESQGRKFDRSVLLSGIYRRLMEYTHAMQHDLCGELEQRYLSLLYMLNVPCNFKLPDGTIFGGVIRTVAHSGELVVEDICSHHTHAYLFKEIEFCLPEIT